MRTLWHLSHMLTFNTTNLNICSRNQQDQKFPASMPISQPVQHAFCRKLHKQMQVWSFIHKCVLYKQFFFSRESLYLCCFDSFRSVYRRFWWNYDMSRASTNMILKLRITILTVLVLHFPSPLGIFSSNWNFLLVQDIKRREHKKNSFFSFGSIAPYLSVESAFLSYASWMKK